MGMDQFSYRERKTRELNRWIECIWSLETAQDILNYPVLPDGCVDILFSSGGSLEIVGPMTRRQLFRMPAGTRLAGVRFRPGMASSFLQLPVYSLTDRSLPLEDLWGSAARQLEARLQECQSVEQCCSALLSHLPLPNERPDHVQRVVEAITAASGNVDIEQILNESAISERHLRRRVLEVTGLSPKKLCRVLRFRHACDLRTGGLPWGRIATEAGYFDQAHLIRDFRDFACASPMAVFSNT
jgi:AraC-like DNA-binding protein